MLISQCREIMDSLIPINLNKDRKEGQANKESMGSDKISSLMIGLYQTRLEQAHYIQMV